MNACLPLDPPRVPIAVPATVMEEDATHAGKEPPPMGHVPAGVGEAEVGAGEGEHGPTRRNESFADTLYGQLVALQPPTAEHGASAGTPCRHDHWACEAGATRAQVEVQMTSI